MKPAVASVLVLVLVLCCILIAAALDMAERIDRLEALAGVSDSATEQEATP